MQVTPRDLQIIASIERYKFLPTSLLLLIIPGSERGKRTRLNKLYHAQLINRITRSIHEQDVYYLDNLEALQLLTQRTQITPDELDWNTVRNNRNADHANAFKPLPIIEALNPQQLEQPQEPVEAWVRKPLPAERQGRSTERLDHELMISRFHFQIEWGARHSTGKVELHTWAQGPKLWNHLKIPKLFRDKDGDWDEAPDQLEEHPHRPDAFFTLRFPQNPLQREFSYFFYEAELKAGTNRAKHKRKMRRHFHYVVKQRKHREDHKVHRIRAVLTETLDLRWAKRLLVETRDWVVPSSHNYSALRLFWFVPSEYFLRPTEITDGEDRRVLPYFLAKPNAIFRPLWATASQHPDDPNLKLHSLLDD